MRLLLIRHAHAEEGDDDAARPLSRRGREQVRVVARFLRRQGGLGATEVWHSSLVRSRETAERLVRRLEAPATLKEVTGLAPYDDPRTVVLRLARRRDPLVIVGHEPNLGLLAALLMLRRAEPDAFVLKKAGILRLDRTRSRWSLVWQVAPALIR